MQLLIANWKSHKTYTEALEWMRIFTSFDLHSLSQELEIVICPPAPLLLALVPYTANHAITLGTQDISPALPGAHTGEVTGENLVGLVKYVIIGHSETRRDLHEDEETIEKKIEQAKRFSIRPIVCVNQTTKTDYDVDILAFEPEESVGTQHPTDVNTMAQFKSHLEIKPDYFLYGGSVESENAKDYLENNLVNGFLVGTNSLDPLNFYAIAQQF